MKKSKKQRNFDKKKSNAYDQNKKKIILYKTEFCRSFEETGYCRYKEKCQFAHSIEELRPVDRHPKYRTEMCKTFWEQGTCPYGKRCCFIHTFKDDIKNEDLVTNNLIETNMKQLNTPTTTPVISNLTVDSKSSFVLNPRLDNNSSKNNSINMNGSNDSKMNINAKSFEPTTTASTATTTVATTTTKKIESNSTQHGNVNLNTPQPKNFDSVSELSTTSTMYSNPSLPSYNISKANSNGSELPSSSTDSSTLFDFDNSNILNMEAYNTLIKNSNTNHNNINFTHSLDNSKYNYCASPSSSNNSRGPSMDPINNIMERNESNDFRQTEMIKGQITEDSVNHNLMNRTINNHSNDFIYYNNSVQSTNPINNGMNMSMYYSSLNPLINVNNNSNSQLNSQISSSKYSSLSVYSTMDSIDKSTPNTPNSIINSPCPMNASVIPPSSYMNEQDHSFTNPNYSIGTNVNWIKHHSSLDKLNMMKMAGNGMNFNPSDTISDVSTINKMKISNSMDDYSFSMLPQNLHNINKSNSVNHPIIPNQMKTMNHSEPLVERDRNNFLLNYYSMMNGSIDNHRSLVSNPNFMNTNLSCNNVNDTFSTNENDDYPIYKEKDVDMERAKLFSAFANPKFHHMNDYLRTVQNYNTNEVLNNSSMNTRLQEKDAMTAAAVNMNMLQASFSNNNQYRKINNIISDFSTLSISNNHHPSLNHTNFIPTEPSLTASP